MGVTGEKAISLESEGMQGTEQWAVTQPTWSWVTTFSTCAFTMAAGWRPLVQWLELLQEAMLVHFHPCDLMGGVYPVGFPS